MGGVKIYSKIIWNLHYTTDHQGTAELEERMELVEIVTRVMEMLNPFINRTILEEVVNAYPDKYEILDTETSELFSTLKKLEEDLGELSGSLKEIKEEWGAGRKEAQDE